MQGPHSHYDDHMTRIVPEKIVQEEGMRLQPEKIQFICLQDGEIFREMEIKNPV